MFTFLLNKARWARQKFKMETNLKKIAQLKWPKYEKTKLRKWNEPNKSGNFQSCWRNEIHCPIELFIWWFKRKPSDAEYVIPWLYRENCQWCDFSLSLTVLPVSKEILKDWFKCWTKGYKSLLVTLSFLLYIRYVRLSVGS